MSAGQQLLAATGGVVIGPPSLMLNFTGGALDPRITFTRADASTCASYFDQSGVLRLAAANVPRFDYNPSTGSARGLLIEEQRTNLLLNSATLSTQSVTVTAVAHTLSFYGTGTVTLSGASTAGPLVGSGALPNRVTLTFTPTAGTLTLTVTGTVQYAQLEVGGFASSYITTTGASATRSADAASVNTLSPWFNATAGSLFTESQQVETRTGISFQRIVVIDNNSLSNAINHLWSSAASRLYTQANSSGIEQYSIGTDSVTQTNVNRMASAFAANDFAVSINGAAVSTNTSGSVPAGLTTLRIGAAVSAGSQLNGCIRRITYYPRRLTNTELQAITT